MRTAPRWKSRFVPGTTLLVIVVCGLLAMKATPVHAQVYTPPNTVTVTMYRLNQNGSSTGTPCRTGNPAYGCTAYPGTGDPNLAYPFLTSTVTLSIEGTAVNNRYLRDVLVKEIVVSAFHPTAIRAQAIAARTYIYYHIRQGSTIDNSTNFQVFVPRAYDTLTIGDKQKIDTALQSPQYLSTAADVYPILSEFFADRPWWTVQGGYPYLKGVYDPISSHPAIVPDGHGRGMSQNGAARWARGNLGFNLNQDLGKWSVTWSDASQLLVHYYTGIHLRDMNKTAITPAYRWNPLQLSWPTVNTLVPQSECSGASVKITAVVQNTGVTTWPNDGSVYFSYSIPAGMAASQALATSIAIPPQPIAPGDFYTATITYQVPTNLPDGSFTAVRFDMYGPKSDGSKAPFSQLDPTKPWFFYTDSFKVVKCRPVLFLPALRSDTVAQ